MCKTSEAAGFQSERSVTKKQHEEILGRLDRLARAMENLYRLEYEKRLSQQFVMGVGSPLKETLPLPSEYIYPWEPFVCPETTTAGKGSW